MREFFITSELDRSRALGYLAGVSIGKHLKVDIKAIKSKRSAAQNKLLWLWNNEIQVHMRDVFGQMASAQEWHDVLVAKLWPADVHIVNLPDGTAYKVGRAKSRTFTTAQMAAYLELLDSYCADSLGLQLPHPSDLMMQVYGRRK